MEVNRAMLKDIEDVFLLCLKMHKEGSFKNIIASKEKLQRYLSKKVENKNSLFLVLKKNQQVIGFFIAEICEYFFSEEKLAVDELFFIEKKFRKSIGAKYLIAKYVKWAKSNHAIEICLSSTNGVEMDKLERFYSKFGFKKAGVMYKKGV